MNGNWLTKTKKAYVYRTRARTTAFNPCAIGYDPGWFAVLLHGDSDYESFWYPTWDLAIRAIPDLWRH